MIIRHLANICFLLRASVSVSVLLYFFEVQFHALGYTCLLLLFQSFAFHRSVSHVSQMGWSCAVYFLWQNIDDMGKHRTMFHFL